MCHITLYKTQSNVKIARGDRMKNCQSIGICTVLFMVTYVNGFETDICPDFYGGINCTDLCLCANITDKEKHFEKYCKRTNNGCICKPGWISANCNKICDELSYGRACSKQCNCSAEVCHHVTGCPVTRGDTVQYSLPSVTTTRFTENTTPHPDTEFKLTTLLIPIIVVTSLIITVSLLCLSLRRSRCCLHSKKKTYKNVKYSDTSIITNNMTSASEYSYIDISDEVFSEARSSIQTKCDDMSDTTPSYSQTTTSRNAMATNHSSCNVNNNMTNTMSEYAEAYCDVESNQTRNTTTKVNNDISDDVQNTRQDGEYHILLKKERIYDNPSILLNTEICSSTNGIYNKLNHSGRSESDLNIINQYESVSMFRVQNRTRNGDTQDLSFVPDMNH